MNFHTVLLFKDHDRTSFECEQPTLSSYLKVQANQDIQRRVALCFVALDKKSKVIGYYTLSNASIPKESLPENIQKKHGYKDLPVTLLGRLARDIHQKGTGLGELLLIDALSRSYEASGISTASFAVVTDPFNEWAENFYGRYGFQKLEGSSRMFLMMKTLEPLFK